ncbi:zinc finger protein 654 [Bufo gargarizans]|uniref:zinc finger protein 654 n=1 Tax=Bufo gargarizans TaxID=30331 RepID=UPI001CF1DA95|nr:zinc finger protein 654 [Bufo gargarizans]
MAEDESDQESERLVEELEAIAEEELRGPGAGDVRSLEYCRRFCEVVEEYTARWQVPLPQLQVLQTALCCFTSASVSFPAECERVQHVLSRLALSLFELLLFFGKDEFYEAPLKDILGSVQECHDLLIRYDNPDLREVTCVIKDGGPWEDPVLQAVLKGKSEPQDIVDRYLRSENQLFFEFRVRYLIACERISEAVALITTCLSHPEVSKNLYYHQAYFMCLHMTRLTERLLPEHVLRLDCSDGVRIICNIEKEGKTALALQLSEAFLITQLQTGKMYCIWELIFIWSKLQLKVNPSKEAFVEQCYNMLRIAANVKAIFPFMKTIREEIGEGSVQLSVELCGCALQLDLQGDPETKSLIYKTIAYLLPTDLEICRICALSVFFLERTVESYEVVEGLYRYCDEDYNEFASYVENRVRFELLPILKRGLVFDPEFWNFSMIQTNCAALLGDNAALVLPKSDAVDIVVEQQSLPLDGAVTPLHNGERKHKESRGNRHKVSSEPKKNHTVLTPHKMDTNTPRHHCTLCNREFLGGHILRHAQTHHKKGWFSCVICARKIRNKVSMLRHLKHHLKKMQRHQAGNSLKASSDPSPGYSDTNKANSLETSSSTNEVNSLETSSSTNEANSLETSSSTNEANSLETSSSTNEANSLETSSSTNEANSLETSSSTKKANSLETSSSETGNSNQDLMDSEHIIPGRNHTMDHNRGNVNDSTATQTSCSTDVSNSDETTALSEMQGVEDDAGRDTGQCVKINGSLFCKFDPVVNHQVPCPAQGCHRVFQKVRALNKHARKAHPSDVKVQQHIMTWNKSKCRFCQRKFVNCRHFVDHLNRHVYPNVYFCMQLNCNQRYKYSGQLIEHQQSHETLEVQCGYTNCPEIFDKLSSLYEHEALHYKQIPLDNTTSVPNTEPLETVHVPQEDSGSLEPQPDVSSPSSKTEEPPRQEEAPDLHIPIWKSRKDVAEPKTYKQAEKKLNGEVHLAKEVLQTSCDVGQDPIPEDNQGAAPEEHGLNGHMAQEPSAVVETATVEREMESNPPDSDPDAAQETAPTARAKQSPVAFSNAYGTVGVRPFSRPLPPSYLDEQYISMPKRRKNELELTSENHTVSEPPVEKWRCGKCLTNYCSSEALEQHLAQKKCQLYFGFDSDDESAW